MINANNSREMIKRMAEETGKTEDQIIADLIAKATASEPQLPRQIAVPGQPENELAQWIEALSKAGGKDGDNSWTSDMKEIAKMGMQMQMMKAMMSGNSPTEAPKPAVDVEAVVQKALKDQAQTFKEIMAEKEAQRKEEAYLRRLDHLETMIQDGGGRKSDAVMDEIKDLKGKLDQTKEAAHKAELTAAKDALEQFRRDMKYEIEALRNKELPKDPTTAFFEIMQRSADLDKVILSRGKALGLTDAVINSEVAKDQPLLSTIFQTLAPILKNMVPAQPNTGMIPAPEGYVESAQLADVQDVPVPPNASTYQPQEPSIIDNNPGLGDVNASSS